ncbi:hypothetical protein GC197_13060 [bacterium]|nr:hypothetical protein [bacterium]
MLLVVAAINERLFAWGIHLTSNRFTEYYWFAQIDFWSYTGMLLMLGILAIWDRATTSDRRDLVHWIGVATVAIHFALKACLQFMI